jgi:hypothetical protein
LRRINLQTQQTGKEGRGSCPKLRWNKKWALGSCPTPFRNKKWGVHKLAGPAKAKSGGVHRAGAEEFSVNQFPDKMKYKTFYIYGLLIL